MVKAKTFFADAILTSLNNLSGYTNPISCFSILKNSFDSDQNKFYLSS
jgi:hypothetical protein